MHTYKVLLTSNAHQIVKADRFTIDMGILKFYLGGKVCTVFKKWVGVIVED